MNSILKEHKVCIITLYLLLMWGCGQENDNPHTNKNHESRTSMNVAVKQVTCLTQKINDIHAITNVSGPVDVEKIRDSLMNFKNMVDVIGIETDNEAIDPSQRMQKMLSEKPKDWTEKDWAILKKYVEQSTNEIDGIWMEHISTFLMKYHSTGSKEAMGSIAQYLIDIGTHAACLENRYYFLIQGAHYLVEIDKESAATIALETANEMYENSHLSSQCIFVALILTDANQREKAEKLIYKLTEDPKMWEKEDDRLYTKLFAAFIYNTQNSPDRIKAIELLNNMATDETVSQEERDYFSGYMSLFKDSPEYDEYFNNK